MACRVFAVLNSFWRIDNSPKNFFLFWPDFPVKTRFKFPAGTTPFKIGRLIKSKRALGLAGRDVISGKKNFHIHLIREDFSFERTYRLIVFWVNTLTRNNCITDLHESTIALVLSWNDVIRNQTPSSWPTLKGVAPVGNLNHISGLKVYFGLWEHLCYQV